MRHSTPNRTVWKILIFDFREFFSFVLYLKVWIFFKRILLVSIYTYYKYVPTKYQDSISSSSKENRDFKQTKSYFFFFFFKGEWKFSSANFDSSALDHRGIHHQLATLAIQIIRWWDVRIGPEFKGPFFGLSYRKYSKKARTFLT